MAYKEKYPLDITPQGDTVPESIQKNRQEILEVAQQVELKAGTGGVGGSGLRNRVLYGRVTNGVYSFLTSDNLSVIIDGSKTPVLLSFADGFNDYGGVDYVQQITTRSSAWSLPANQTSYLYIERSNSGGLSYGSTTLEPLRQASAPTSELNKMYYSTIDEKMYFYNGTQWKSVGRVVVAKVDTNATQITSITYYDPNANTATDTVIGKRTVDGTAYSLTDALNILADSIKAIAGDEHLSKNPSTTLQSIKAVIDGLDSKYYKRTDTVANATHAVNSDNATNANYATTAGTANTLSDGDKTINGGLTATAGIISKAGLDWDNNQANKVVFSTMSRGTFGVPQNGMVMSFGGDSNWRGYLFMSDNGTDGMYYGGNSNGQGTDWHRLYGDGQQDRILFRNGTELWIE